MPLDPRSVELEIKDQDQIISTQILKTYNLKAKSLGWLRFKLNLNLSTIASLSLTLYHQFNLLKLVLI